MVGGGRSSARRERDYFKQCAFCEEATTSIGGVGGPPVTVQRRSRHAQTSSSSADEVELIDLERDDGAAAVAMLCK